MATDRMPRDAIKASLWQFDPTTEEEVLVEAMASGVVVQRSDEDRVILTARGRPRGRYESGDSTWLEFDDSQALRLIQALASALREGFPR